MLGRGLVISGTECDITARFHKYANSVHIVVVSGPDEWGIPTLTPPIDRCPLRNESLGFCRLSIMTGPIKFLVDVQSAFQGRVSACGPAASAASYLCFGTRSRRAARAGGNAYLSKLGTILLLCVLLAQGLPATWISSYFGLRRCGNGSSNVRIRGMTSGATHCQNHSAANQYMVTLRLADTTTCHVPLRKSVSDDKC